MPENRPRYMMLLRQGLGPPAIPASLEWNLAEARDFDFSAVRRSELGPRDILHLDQVRLLVVPGERAEVERMMSIPEFARHVAAYEVEGFSTLAVQTSDEETVNTFDESIVTWGLQVTQVSDSALTGRGVRVAVLDSALDLDHQDFAPRRGEITLETLTTGPADHSICIHGTAVAGILCGPAAPVQGPRYGVAPNCELFFGRVTESGCSYGDADLVEGINWAMANGCRIANLSLGRPVKPGQAPSLVFQEVCSQAAAAGMLIVAAAGNRSERQNGIILPVEEPANALRALAVGAITIDGEVAPFSNGGVDLPGGAVDLIAPGDAIHSSCANIPGKPYSRFNLTSMATPFVSGIAALWLEKHRDLTVAELWQRMQETALPLGDPRDAGAGLVQAPPS
jgi:subtilisin family serine protease